MKVELISYTPDALELLLYTKDTRLQGAQSLQDIVEWPEDEKMEHLAYMRDTIQSSWEFVEYTFKISGVSRSFTHQFVRTRTGSYAQQSQRTVDVSGSNVYEPPSCNHPAYRRAVNGAMECYAGMIKDGVAVQDARGILPTNITTDIIAKFDLRTLHNMGLLRLCTRTQGEYQEVFKAMVDEVVKVHPWAEEFIRVYCAWHGTCAFPRYKECPIQKHCLDPSFSIRNTIQQAWEETNHVAVPVAKEGRTM